MADNINFRFFGIFLVLVSLILFLGFVLANIDFPTDLIFGENDTANYDNDGTVFLNWTSGANGGALFYGSYISVDGTLFILNATNNSETGYIFTNTTDGNYSFIVQAENATDASNSTSNTWMVVDTTIPAVLYTTGTSAASAAANRDWIFVNVTATDINNVSSFLVFSLHNSSGVVNQTQFSYPSSGEQSINWTGLVVNVAYTYNVTGNDSATNSNVTPTRTFTLDNVAPSVGLTKSSSGSSSLVLTISGAEGTCTADRSGATISGSTLTESGLSCGKSYTYTVTCTDSAGNAGSSSATSFSTTGCSSGDNGGTTTKPPKKIQSWSKITPGVVTIMKNFDPEIGIKEIQIEVNNNAQNVKITVTKYAGKPAEVSVVKSGKVYQYLQIDAQNLADKLSKATVMFRAGKSWLSSNGLGVEDVALFRFDDSAGQWSELPTTHTGSEGDDELYEVELTSFSFFAISEKGTVGADAGETGGTGETGGEEKRSLAWLWVLIAVVILVGLGWRIRTRK